MSASPEAHVPRVLESELFLVAAPTRDEVAARAEALAAAVRRHPTVPLADLALSVSQGADCRGPCLSLVASSAEDLAGKLAGAAARLREPACREIRERSGVWYADERMAAQGRIAWMFPGEGAQYPKMLQDLAIHFPEVRAMFDLVDRACREEDPRFVPSRYVFPPPGEAADDASDLFAWDAAVMAVIGANTALMKLLQELKVPADATVGHSFGDFAALELGGILQGGEDQRLPLIRLAYRQIHEISALEGIPEAVLLNVGGADREAIDTLLGRHPGKLSISMANCPHQYILCAIGSEREAVAADAVRFLASQGALCGPLPFHRPYHTAEFAPAMAVERQFYEEAGVRPPRMPVYSCCTADRLPEDPAAITEVVTRHWASPIRFQETIERMHDDGIRVFLETGPRGNLCAFVEDILRDRPHLAIPLDRESRGTIGQLHRALGMLAAHGFPVDVAPLHRRRGSRALDLHGDIPPEGSRRRTVPMGLQCPQIDAQRYIKEVGTLSRLLRSPAVAAHVGPAPAQLPPVSRPVSRPPAGPATPASTGTDAAAMTPGIHPHAIHAVAAAPVPAELAARDPRPQDSAPRDEVMAAFGATLERFLAIQQEIAAWLRPGGPDQEGPASAPLLGTILHLLPGESIALIKDLDVDRETFILDHALGRDPSALDPSAQGLPLMPLLFSVEMMSEAALALLGEPLVLVAFEDVRANRGIFFERGHVRVHLVAWRLSAQDGEARVRAQIREHREPSCTVCRDPLSRQGPPLCEATVVLAPSHPPEETAPTVNLRNATRVDWPRDEIYRRTFQGPAYQGLVAMESMADDGASARMEVLPRDRLFRGVPQPPLTYDPLTADCMGQMVRVWANRTPDSGSFHLPYHTEALRLYEPPLPPGTPLTVTLAVRSDQGGLVTADIWAFHDNGRLHAAIRGLTSRAFALPPALGWVLHDPVGRAFCAPWNPPPAARAALPARLALSRLAGIDRAALRSSAGIWLRVWAFLILSPGERDRWLALPPAPDPRIDWLWGRTAVKDAARALLLEAGGPRLGAADIVLGEAQGGWPLLVDGWTGTVSHPPLLSFAITPDGAMAVAADLPPGASIGLDVRPFASPGEGGGEELSPQERQHLPAGSPAEGPAWTARALAARGAAREAMARRGIAAPSPLPVEAVEPESGAVRLGGTAAAIPGGRPVAPVTFLQDGLAVAICVLPGTA